MGIQSMDETSPEQLIEVAYSKTVFEAQTKAAILRDAGIDAIVPDTDGEMFAATSNNRPTTNVPVLVKKTDEIRAKQQLGLSDHHGIGVDWDNVDVGEMDEIIEPGGRKTGVYFMLGIVVIIVIIALLIKLL